MTDVMSRSKALFLASPETQNAQSVAVFNMGGGYQCWNQKRFSRDDFISN